MWNLWFFEHSTIEQLDGHNEDNSDDIKYRNTEHYWVRGWLGSDYQNYIDANELIESSEISEGAKIIEKDKLLDARKLAIGTNFKNLPPWNSVGKKKNWRNLLQDTESINNRRTWWHNQPLGYLLMTVFPTLTL